MLTIKKDLNVYDFIDEFGGLTNVDFADEHVALGIIYDMFCDLYGRYGTDEIKIRDYIRYQVEEMDADYFIEQYGHLMNLEEDATDDEKHAAIEHCLHYYTFYVGYYEHVGVIYYLFDEF